MGYFQHMNHIKSIEHQNVISSQLLITPVYYFISKVIPGVNIFLNVFFFPSQHLLYHT